MPPKLTGVMLWHYIDTPLFYWHCATTCYRRHVIRVTYVTWNIRQLTYRDGGVKRWNNIYILGGPRKKLCNRKRVPLQGSRAVTDTPSYSCSCSCYTCYLTCYICYWLPCDRAWFSARSLGHGLDYVRDHLKYRQRLNYQLQTTSPIFNWTCVKNSEYMRYTWLGHKILHLTVHVVTVLHVPFISPLFYHSLSRLLLSLSLLAQIQIQRKRKTLSTSSTSQNSSRLPSIHLVWTS